jgi:type II secretory pathway component GspD/PulD (secretin)
MRKDIRRIVITGIATSLVSLLAWSAEDLVTVNLMDADLITAVRAIAQQVNVEVVFEPTDQPYKKISFLKLERKPFEQALGYICQAAGATYRKEANGVYVIGPVRPKPEVQPTPTQPVTEAPRPQIITERIPLRYSRPSDIKRIIEAEAMSEDPFAELREFMERNLKSNTMGMQLSVPPAVPLRLDGTPVVPMNPVPPTLNPVPPAQPPAEGGEGQFVGGRGGGRGFGQPGGPGGFGQPGGPGGFGQPGGPGGFGQPGGGVSIFQPEGLQGIFANDPDNSLIVQGTPEAIEYIRRILRFIDIAPKQVLIRAEFVTVSRNDLEQFGIDWNLARVNLTAGATGFANRNAPVFVNYATGNLAANLRTLLTQGRGRVVNAPIVTTMNNVPAAVSFVTNDWIEIQQTFFDPQGRPIVFTTPFPLFAISALQVMPRVNADGTITLSLAPSITTPGRVQVGAQQLPRFDSQSVFTVRRIKNGETIVIGGLVSRTDSNTVQKVPILGDLPVLGQFFRTKDRAVVENELLIFITATVLEDDAPSGQLAP